MANTEKTSLLGRLLQTVGGSAEYAVALALLLVCGVVGGVIWLGGKQAAEPTKLAAAPAVSPALVQGQQDAAERQALEDLQREMRERMNEIEEQKRLEAEQAEQARLLAEHRQRELAAAQAEKERLAEEARQRELSLREAAERRRRAELARQTAAAAAREPVRTSAMIRWSSCRQPEYPRSSRVAGEEGVVVLSLDVDETGLVTDGRIKESSGSQRLDLTTLRSLKKCRFDPATVDGVPQATTGDVRFAWTLE